MPIAYLQKLWNYYKVNERTNMESDKIEIGLAQKEIPETPGYYSFLSAVLYLYDEKYIEDYGDCCEKITQLVKTQEQKINKIVNLLEKESFEKKIRTYKNINGEFKREIFKKHNPQTSLSQLGILSCADEPLYKIYNQYFYDSGDLFAMIEKYNRALNNEYTLAHGYSNNVLKLMYEFSGQTDMKNFLKLPLDTQKQDIIAFAEKMKIQISTTVGEAIAIVLDGKLKRTRGANKK